MATKSFSRDIIVSSSRAIKLLKSSLKKGSIQSERQIAPKGSKIVSNFQVQNILRDY